MADFIFFSFQEISLQAKDHERKTEQELKSIRKSPLASLAKDAGFNFVEPLNGEQPHGPGRMGWNEEGFSCGASNSGLLFTASGFIRLDAPIPRRADWSANWMLAKPSKSML